MIKDPIFHPNSTAETGIREHIFFLPFLSSPKINCGSPREASRKVGTHFHFKNTGFGRFSDLGTVGLPG